MLNQPSLFTNTAQIPPRGLTTGKVQALDPLEGFRRPEEAKEDLEQGLFKT